MLPFMQERIMIRLLVPATRSFRQLAQMRNLALVAGCRGGGVASSTESAAHESESVKLIKVDGSPGVEMDGEGLQLAGITTTTAGVEGLSKSLQPTGEVAATDVGTVQVTARLP